MHGGIGSMDTFNVTVEKYSHMLKQNNLSGKSKQTCRHFNLTANHRRQILHTTPAPPVRWNDKTIVLFDVVTRELNNVTIIKDHMVEFLERTSDGSIVAVKHRGD